MVIWTVIGGRGVSSVMTIGGGPSMPNVIELGIPAASALRMAWRSEPIPLSALVVTTKVFFAVVVLENSEVLLVEVVRLAVIRTPGASPDDVRLTLKGPLPPTEVAPTKTCA